MEEEFFPKPPFIIHSTIVRTKAGEVECIKGDYGGEEEYLFHFHNIARQFDNKSRIVTKVEFIVNEKLCQSFSDMKKTMSNPRNILVFHGTTRSALRKIVSEGFKIGGVEVRRRHGKLHGNGVYTSTDPQDSVGFSEGKRVIASFALIDIEGIHQKQIGKWYVILNGKQMLPCYIVHFNRPYGYQKLKGLPLCASETFPLFVPEAPSDQRIESTTSSSHTVPTSISSTKLLQQLLKNLIRQQEKISEADRKWVIDTEKLTKLNVWEVILKNFDPKLPLSRDLIKHGLVGVRMQITFPPDFPVLPPFIRIVSPRMLRFQNGGGGNITAGGSICIELLTITDSEHSWNSRISVDMLFEVVHTLLSQKGSRVARLDKHNWNKDYTMSEAQDAFTRVAHYHRWSI